jgi:DNA mismatch repair ATPase MutS
VGAIPALWIVTLSIYGAFYSYHANLLREFLDALIVMDRELGKFQAILRYLEVYPLHTQVNLRRLCGPFRDPERLPSVFLRKIKFATAGVGLRMNPVLSLMVNLLLPWDFFFASLAAKYREEAAEVLPPWLQTWYKMEALISLANFSYLNPDYTFPVIESGLEPVFRAEGLGHPLIPPDQKVCNDFSVRGLGEIAIVTGSNMAGKSTFIKTLGINLCLAYAGGPVNASDFRSVPMRLHTCIQISDSVTDGFSYFYAEVKCLKQLMEALEAPQSLPVLYLIDEIFRGTNNRERLIGSRAYLKSVIGANGVGLLATHDLELASLADQNPVVRNFHFRDHVLDGELTFDYKIRPGASPTTNALIIMAMEGLPVEETDLPEIQ